MSDLRNLPYSEYVKVCEIMESTESVVDKLARKLQAQANKRGVMMDMDTARSRAFLLLV